MLMRTCKNMFYTAASLIENRGKTKNKTPLRLEQNASTTAHPLWTTITMSGTSAGANDVINKRNKAKRGSGDDCATDASAGKKKQRRERDHSSPAEQGETLPVSSSHNGSAADTNDYPYHVVPDDHCETPIEAYQDVASFLETIAGQLGKTRETLNIFDPYYCEGSMKERLSSLGFKNVINEKRDFYERIRNGTLPQFDVLVTNPPYSGDHMEKLLRFCTGEQCRRPWFLLMPNYVYTKDYYGEIFGGSVGGKSSRSEAGAWKASKHANLVHPTTAGAVVQQTPTRPPFYVTPAGNRRYLYTTPKGRRQEKSAKYTSPFPTFWYCQVYE